MGELLRSIFFSLFFKKKHFSRSTSSSLSWSVFDVFFFFFFFLKKKKKRKKKEKRKKEKKKKKKKKKNGNKRKRYSVSPNQQWVFHPQFAWWYREKCCVCVCV